MKSTVTHRKRRITVFLCLSLLLITTLACSTLSSVLPPPEETPTTTPIPETATPIPPTASPTPRFPAFSADTVMDIPSISPLVGEGTIHFKAGDDPQTLKIFVTGKMPIVNGYWCLTCLDNIKIDPDVQVPTKIFVEVPAQAPVAGLISDYMSMSNAILSYTIPANITEFIVAGPDGATLTKVGRGFRLLKGSAYLMDTTLP